MTGLDPWMTRIRIVAIAAVLVVVQYGLVQHAIEHHPAEVDAACEYCVAGHQPGTPLPSAAPADLDVPAVPTVVVRRDEFLPAGPIGPQRARAPPVPV